MYLVAFVLAVAGAALSLIYSGALSAILEHGAALTWLKGLTPAEMCVMLSCLLSVIGALFAIFRKKFAAVLLIVAAGALGYAKIKLGESFPYSTASAVMFAIAGAVVWLAKGKAKNVVDEEASSGAKANEEIEKILPELSEESNVAAEAQVAAQPAEAVPAEAVKDVEARAAVSGPVEDKKTAEDVKEAAVESAPEEAAEIEAVEKVSEPETVKTCSCKSRIYGLILGLISAGYALGITGTWKMVSEHGTDLSWLSGIASFDVTTIVVLAIAALSVVGGLLGLIGVTLGALMLAGASVLSIYASYNALFPHAWVIMIVCLCACVFAWPQTDTKRAARRYTCAYVYAFVFGACAVGLLLWQSGIACDFIAQGCKADAINFAVMACPVKLLITICAVGFVGTFFALFGVRLSAVLLVISMFGTLFAEIFVENFCNYAWVSFLLFALAAMLASSYESSAVEKRKPIKRFTLHAAFLSMLVAAVFGGALIWQYSKAEMSKKLSAIRTNDPEYQKLESDIADRDAKIAEITASVQQQADLVAQRDVRIADLSAQISAKDAENASLADVASKADAQIVELNEQLDAVKEELAAAQANARKKYVYAQGTVNIRDKPSSEKGSKVIGRLNNEVAEIIDAKRPAGSTAFWYQVKGDFGTGWVFGKNTIVIRPKK